MKTIITCILIILIQGITDAQSQLQTRNSENFKSCTIIYSEEYEALVYPDTLQIKCNEIVIESIPPFTQLTTPLIISFKKGSYTLKKMEGLIIPNEYTVFIEDLLTGQTFDLKNSVSYTFSVNRSIADRFVMTITKQDSKMVSSVSND